MASPYPASETWQSVPISVSTNEIAQIWYRFFHGDGYWDSTSRIFRVITKPRAWKGLSSIASAVRLESKATVSTVSLLYAASERPRLADIRELAGSGDKFRLSFDPAEEGAGEEEWVELLVSGLTYDLKGLAPGPPGPDPKCSHYYGLPPDFDTGRYEAITLVPGPHLAGGETMFPVVRSLALLAAHLAALEGTRAVAWQPARTCSEPQYFRRSVLGWIEGGTFPGLGLTALVNTPDGAMVSEGLAIFTGQELLLPPELARDGAEAAKIALRLLNWLVEHGRIDEPFTFTGPSGEPLGLEPVENSGILRVWRGSP